MRKEDLRWDTKIINNFVEFAKRIKTKYPDAIILVDAGMNFPDLFGSVNVLGVTNEQLCELHGDTLNYIWIDFAETLYDGVYVDGYLDASVDAFHGFEEFLL